MSLLGEINKTSEALRFHSKSAETAGKNLAHVNDESYARQRVVAREGSMFSGNGTLTTSALESAGLEHARNVLIDRRVIGELSDSSALEAEKEIFDLLESALGEKLLNTNINSGLDDSYESILSPGSLARALNDFFNAFQELSASPNEPTVKHELLNRVKGLVNRFNEAGTSIDEIESDINSSVKSGVNDVNRILGQIHEVNKLVRRFELQDQGQATTYRDRRQALLEDLSKFIDIKVEDDIDINSSEPTGFVNVYVQSSNGNKLNLLKSTGPLNLTTGVNDQFTLSNGSGLDAQFSLKTTSENTLGYIEIEQAGTGFSEDDNYLVAFPPPKGPSLDLDQNNEGAVNAALVEDGNALDPAGQPLALEDGISPEVNGNLNENNFSSDNPERNKGDVFYFPNNDGTVSLWQALENTIAGVDPNGSASFMEISDLPSGKFEESKKFMSDVESFEKGEQIFYKGKLYQATEKVSPVSSEDGEQISRSYLSGEIFELNGSFFQATSKISKGTDIDLNKLSLNPVGTVTVLNDTDLNDQSTVLSLGNVLPSNQNAVQFPLDQLLGDLQQGQYVQENGSFYITNENIPQEQLGTSTPLSDPSKFTKINVFSEPVLYLGDTLQQAQNLDGFEGRIFQQNDKHYKLLSSPINLTNNTDLVNLDLSSGEFALYFEEFVPQLLDDGSIVRKDAPNGYNLESGVLEEVQVGLAKAIIRGGEIEGFDIINEGGNIASNNDVFIQNPDGGLIELAVTSGSIAGFQNAGNNIVSKYREDLNTLVADLVSEVNKIYNSNDDPGGYLFQFDALLTQPQQQSNDIMESTYGLYGVEGNGSLKLYSNEVEMTLPYAEDEQFFVTNLTNIYPEEFEGDPFVDWVRGSAETQLELDDPYSSDFYQFYGSARRLQHITFDSDKSFLGDDQLLDSGDEGRSVLIANEDIPMRLVEGSKAFLRGDNFSFNAVISNPWNLAKSLQIDDNLTVENVKSSEELSEGSNSIAVAIGNLSDGKYMDDIAQLNANLGSQLSNLNDSLEHQKSVESLLIEQRRAISSVSTDEEVANLMQYQRSFQASSRVLNTLDKMLELVVMGLLK